MADKINFDSRQEELGAGQQRKVSTDNCSLKMIPVGVRIIIILFQF